MAGRVAFVTGAASGIGRTTALAFAQRGASVVIADIGETASRDTARMIQAQGGQVLAVTCDVTSSYGRASHARLRRMTDDPVG